MVEALVFPPTKDAVMTLLWVIPSAKALHSCCVIRTVLHAAPFTALIFTEQKLDEARSLPAETVCCSEFNCGLSVGFLNTYLISMYKWWLISIWLPEDCSALITWVTFNCSNSCSHTIDGLYEYGYLIPLRSHWYIRLQLPLEEKISNMLLVSSHRYAIKNQEDVKLFFLISFQTSKCNQ